MTYAQRITELKALIDTIVAEHPALVGVAVSLCKRDDAAGMYEFTALMHVAESDNYIAHSVALAESIGLTWQNHVKNLQTATDNLRQSLDDITSDLSAKLKKMSNDAT